MAKIPLTKVIDAATPENRGEVIEVLMVEYDSCHSSLLELIQRMETCVAGILKLGGRVGDSCKTADGKTLTLVDLFDEKSSRWHRSWVERIAVRR